jgi:PAS domain S-box-containing protein
VKVRPADDRGRRAATGIGPGRLLRLPSIRLKILAVTAIILVPVAVLGSLTYAMFERQLEASRQVRQTLEVIALARTLDGHLPRMQQALSDSVLAGRPSRRDVDEGYHAFRGGLGRLEPAVSDDPGQRARLARMGTALEAWRQGPARASVEAMERGQAPLAGGLVGESRRAIEALRAQMDEFVQVEAGLLDQRTRTHEEAQRRTRWLHLAGGFVVVTGGAALSLLLGRRMTHPLTSLTHAVERMAAGDLSRPVTIQTGDEVERLGSAFNRMVTEVTQREEALNRARREAETFVEVQQDLAETLDLIPVLQKIARHARLLCRSDLAYIAPVDPRTGAARVVALLGERTAALRHYTIEPGRGLAGRVLETRRPIRVANYPDDARVHDAHTDPVSAEAVIAALAVPVILEQELLGLIYVANRTPRAFTEHDEATLLRLAVPAALAVRNARLVGEQAQERDLLAVRSRELARSEGQLRGILQAVSEGILTVDAQGRITSVNRAAQVMFGYAAPELVQQDLHLIIPASATATAASGLQTTSVQRTELEGQRKNGSRFPIELSVSVVRTEHDHFFAVVVRDITERKRAYEARFQLASIVESSDDAIMSWLPDLTITSWNPAAERIYGYSADEVRGKPFAMLVPPERAGEMREMIVRIERGERVENYETVRLTKDGRSIDVSLTISATRDEAGRITGFSTIARDITERKAIERMKDEFIATVSHELRTPLTAIRGHLELVLDGEAGPVTDMQQQFLMVASQNTDRLGALINDLLDVEKIEAGKMQIRRDPVDLAEALRSVVTTFRLQAERKGLSFRDHISDRLVVVGDRDRLIQVFANLVSNAIKYTPAGEVGVRAERTDGQLEVVVHDTGIGISGEEQTQLFSKFFRSQDTVVRDAGGTGLGLVIAKGIVERHGGRISVESEKGVGTRFRVVLP